MTKPGGNRRTGVADSFLGVGGYHHGVAPRRSIALLDALAAVSPGRPLREGLDRILQAGMGALIVVGDGPEVLNICSGGFLLDAAFSPQRLSELAKMDGALIVSPDISYIHYANVQLTPDPAFPSEETGLRHLSGHRTAQQTGDLPQEFESALVTCSRI